MLISTPMIILETLKYFKYIIETVLQDCCNTLIKMRKTNFSNIGIRDDTKKELNDLKEKLEQKYPDVTYDELMNVLMKKHEKVVLTDKDIKNIIARCRGIL